MAATAAADVVGAPRHQAARREAPDRVVVLVIQGRRPAP
jgi:hypothetical protein